MKKPLTRRMVCMLLIAMLAVFCLPLQSHGEELEAQEFFSSFEELQQLCSQASETPGQSLLCLDTEEIVISEDLTIPPDTMVFFLQFCVPEGVTFTVSEKAMLMTAALQVEGELTNYGTVIQEEMSFAEGASEIETVAKISGHITNRGTMTLINVLGKRNITSWGGSLTMSETERFDEILRKAAGIAETPTPTVSPTPAPVPEEEDLADRVLDFLVKYLPKTFFVVLLIVMIRVGKKGAAEYWKNLAEERKAHASGQSQQQETLFTVMDASREDHFEHDKRTRIAQLDDWLRNGLIDRKEYRILKQRYEQESEK